VVADVPAWFTFIRLAPYGSGHHLDGISVIGNTFKEISNSGTIDRIESVVTSNGNYNHTLSKNIVFQGNSYTDINQKTENPAYVDKTQSAATISWSYSHAAQVPFGGQVRGVESWSAIGPIQDGANVPRYESPYFTLTQGASGDAVNVNWPAARKGRIQMRLRSDSVS
jgi:hypothetical protein